MSIELTVDMVHAFLKDRNNVPGCPVCKSNRFGMMSIVADDDANKVVSYFGLAISDATGRMNLEEGFAAAYPVMRPLIACECAECGYVMLFTTAKVLRHLRNIGLLPPNDEQSSDAAAAASQEAISKDAGDENGRG